MKIKHIMFALLTLSFVWTNNFAQYFDQPECGTYTDPESTHYAISLTQPGGKYITANGAYRVLLVFASYPDDTTPHSYWPVGSPPTSMSDFIDPTVNTNSTHYTNLTNYFVQMSFDTYQMIGEAVYVTAPQTRAWYEANSYHRGKVIKDVIQNAVDPLINFSNYDNWTRQSQYNHVNQPDGVVDMIVVIWRGEGGQIWPLGEASLGNATPTTLDGVQIQFGYPTGSGCFVSYRYSAWPGKLLQLMIHETGHWLLGRYHPYGDKYNVWSILGTQFAAGICANSFERERLGWINTTEITESINVPLSDYVTTGVAYKYHPPNGHPEEWYYFENHQKLSIYDDATSDVNDKGVWVIHQQSNYSNNEIIRMKPADGLWNWDSPYYTTQCFSTSLPAFSKHSVNPASAGLSHRDQLPTSPGNDTWMHVFIDDESNLNCSGFFKGDVLFNGSYNLSTTTVISPWSNPGSNAWSNLATNFAAEITGQSGNIVNVHFYYDDAVSSSPAKILDVTVTAAFNNKPLVQWTASTEPDLQHYEVWKKKGSSAWSLHTTTTTNAYVDPYEDIVTGLPQANETIVQYKIRVVDTQYKLSLFSNVVEIRVEILPEQKLGTDGNEPTVVPRTFTLSQNYPNPFNPRTTIVYELPTAAFVELKVFDTNGQLIKTLVRQQRNAGNYSVNWNATNSKGQNVSSGIYLYRLTTTTFTQTKKMVLLQ